MKIILHDESMDIEVGQKVVFYNYQFSDDNQLEVTTDETFVDMIDEKLGIVGFKNGVHSSTLQFYKNDSFGERYFLSDTIENRLRFLKSKVKCLEEKQKFLDEDIKDAYEVLTYRKKYMEDIKHQIKTVNTLVEQLSKTSNKDEGK